MGIKKSTHRSVSLLLVIVLMVGTIFLNDGSVLAESGDPDTTPPSFAEGYPKAGTPKPAGSKAVSLSIHCILDEDETEVTAYYVIVDDGDVPSVEQIIEGKDSKGNTPYASGNGTFKSSNFGFPNIQLKVNGPTAKNNTEYDAYVVLEDKAGNRSNAKKVDLMTPKSLLADGYPRIGTPQTKGSQKVEIVIKANPDPDISPEPPYDYNVTAYYVVVEDGYPEPNRREMAGKEPWKEGYNFIESGSIELEPNTETSIVTEPLGADSTEYDVYVVLLREDYYGEIWSGDEDDYEHPIKIDVTTPEEDPSNIVCEMGDNQYTSLDEAIADIVGIGGTGKIILKKHINYDKSLSIENKEITFVLNGFNLNITNNSEENDGIGLEVKDGKVLIDRENPNGGELNVSGTLTGVKAGPNSEVEVSNATSTNNGRGVLAEGGQVKIENDVDTIRTGLSNAGCGVKALNGARVTVGGDVIGAQAINASGENTMVHVDGKAIGTGDGVAAVYADNKAKVKISDDVESEKHISAEAKSGGEITIDGEIKSRLKYVMVGDVSKTLSSEMEEDTTLDGYITYSEGDSNVWVKGPTWPGDSTLQCSRTSTSMRIDWPKARNNFGIEKYEIYLNGSDNPVGSVDGGVDEPWFEITNLQPGTGYTVSVVFVDKEGNFSEPLVRIFNTLKAYTIAFDSQGGSEIPEQIIDEYDKLDETKLQIPEKDGFVFGGWYKEAECINPWNFEDWVTEDITLYAKWNVDDDHGEDPEEPVDPEDPDEPEDPVEPNNPEDPEDHKGPEDPKEPEETEDSNKNELPKTGGVPSFIYSIVGFVLAGMGIIIRRKKLAL